MVLKEMIFLKDIVNSKMRTICTFLFLAICCQLYGQEPQETTIVVRTKAKDAKFIGTSMGGSLIIIRNAETGQIMASGLTEGSTGNTELIMNTPRERNASIGDGAAKFETSLELTKPVFVTIEAKAPVNLKDSRVIAKTQIWLLPGKHIDDDGVTLEIPGFIVEGLYPQTHQGLSIADDKTVELKANIVMMCGCPLSEGGMWDSNDLEVEAIVYVNGEYWKTIPMKLKSTNTFTANLNLEKTGSHEVVISAYNGKSKNTGVDQLNFRVSN